MINKVAADCEKCMDCGSTMLEKVGSEYYCPECEQVKVIFQEQMRVVPSKYESNSRNKRDLQQERKLNALIREFTDKYRDISSVDEIKLFRQRLTAVKSLTPRKKGQREAAAVVAYLGLKEQIKLSIRQFCQNNNLNIKLFNQKYKIYQKIYKQSIEPISDEQGPLKCEEKFEDQSPTQKSLQQLTPFIPEGAFEGAKRALELLYDHIFNKYIYKSKKSTIIDSLRQKIESIDRDTLDKIKYFQNIPIKIYYIIFAILKSLGHKINFSTYSQIVKDRTGYIIKRKTAGEVKKAYLTFASYKTVKEQQPFVQMESQLQRNKDQSSDELVL